jgi:hypothetical protein
MPSAFISNADDPIASFEEDLLARRLFVDRLAAVMRSAPEKSSSVFGLYGEWGSGKSSIKNLLVKLLAEKTKDPATPIVVEFNAWAFSSQAELFQSFFSEVSKSLGKKEAGDVAVAFSRLGAYLSIGGKAMRSLQVVADVALLPGGAVAGLVADTLERGGEQAAQYGELLQKGEVSSLADVQADLHAALAKLPHPILIVIDDIDRLPPEQMLQMFQVVRVNASLPKINFLLLLDRKSVQVSLERKGYSADFLEKIVQFALDIPHVSDADMRAFLKEGLKEVTGPHAAKIDWPRWDENYEAAYRSLLDTPRKLRRLLHTFRFHLSIFSREGALEVDLVDLFGLEVLRLYAPQLWEVVPDFGKSLFGEKFFEWYMERRNNEETTLQKQIDASLQLVSSGDRESCRALLRTLFPQLRNPDDDAGQLDWLATCRICTDIHFGSYFLLTTNASYPTQHELQTLLQATKDHPQFLKQARALAKKYGFTRLLTKLQPALMGQADPESVRNILAAIWRLDEEDSAIDPVGGEWGHRDGTESFTAYLLTRIGDEAQRRKAAEEALTASHAVYPLFRLTAHYLYLLTKESSRAAGQVFSKENLVALQQRCKEHLDVLRAKDRLVYHPNLGALLRWWEATENRDAVRAWVAEQSGEDQRLLLILCAHFSRLESSGVPGRPRERQTRFHIQRANLKRLFTLDKAFKERLEKIDLTKADQWGRIAVEETLRHIDHEAKGIKEAEYPGMHD